MELAAEGESFFDWLVRHRVIGQEDAGLPMDGLGGGSTPADIVAWALLMDAQFDAGLALTDPAEVEWLHGQWTGKAPR